MKVVVAGGSGFIGRILMKRLAGDGHPVVLLSRSLTPKAPLPPGVTMARWDGVTKGEWWSAVDGADAVVNLSGESIAEGRWTAARKRALTDSRIESTRAIVDAVAGARDRPGVLVNISAVGYYGDVREGDVLESHPSGRGFLPELSLQWEREAMRAAGSGVRVVLPRVGIVLAADGGALPRMALPFRLFVGGPLGGGTQWMPWVHLDDVLGIIRMAIREPALEGPVNVSAPGIVRMSEFSRELGRVLGRPSWFPVPSFVLRLILGEMSVVVLSGQRVIPRKALDAGYAFRYPDLSGALASVFGRNKGPGV
jgi:uncharacterized protein